MEPDLILHLLIHSLHDISWIPLNDAFSLQLPSSPFEMLTASQHPISAKWTTPPSPISPTPTSRTLQTVHLVAKQYKFFLRPSRLVIQTAIYRRPQHVWS